MVNGKVTVSLEDNETGKKSNTGVIALQLHAGGPMKLEVKDISLVSKEKKTSKKTKKKIISKIKKTSPKKTKKIKIKKIL